MKQHVTLVIMAAGIGSRFGQGIKQLEPVGPNGEILMDYSIQEAIHAGFDKVVFVIRKDLENDFRNIIGNRIEKLVKVEYAFQEIADIKDEFKNKFQNRTKPWGTGQAILCCKDLIHEPFLVINADDYYGTESYKLAFEELTREQTSDISMISFILKNTLSENGTVTRGICQVKNGMLEEIVETKNLNRETIQEKNIDINTPVSMNMWCFTPKFFETLETNFDTFLKECETEDNSSEYLLPILIGELLKKQKISVRVLQTNDKWFGMTYKEDVGKVREEILEKYHGMVC